MANGTYTAGDAIKSDEAFRQYVVLWIDRHERWQKNHERWHGNVVKVLVGAPALLLAAFGLFKLALKTTGVDVGP